MKNKLIFRVIGALFSSLIIISVFMPFTNVDSNSLWDSYRSLDMIYLPIMIIVFGSIGVIFFSLNIKTEFAYATSGAIIFFTVMQLVQAISYNTVNSLGLGFYFLAVGGVVTGLMAFLSNLKGHADKKVEGISEMPQMSAISIQTQNIDSMVNPNPVNTTLQNPNIIDNNISQITEVSNGNINEPIPVTQVSNNNQVLSDSDTINTQQATTNVIGNQPQNISINNTPNLSPAMQVPISNETLTTPAPIPEITPQVPQSQPSVVPNNIQDNISANNAPNINLQMNPGQNVNQNVNPVLRDFQQMSPQGQPQTSNNFIPNTNPAPVSSSTPAQANVNNDSTNMQGLDIFGNFK